jgi:hypothetical protein
VDPVKNLLFTAYGPTSGLIKIDLKSRKAQVLPTPEGGIRNLSVDGPDDVLYAVEWMNSELWEVDKGSFQLLKKFIIYRPDAATHYAAIYHDGSYLLSVIDLAGAAKFDRTEGKVTLFTDFYAAKLTKFRCCAQALALDKNKNTFFVEVGHVDIQRRNRIVALDAANLSVKGDLLAPEGGLGLTYVPDNDLLLMTSFFSRNIYVIDASNLKIVRSVKGPYSAFDPAVDRKRNLWYAAGYLDGMLYAIRPSDGATVAKLHLGNKATPICLVPEWDALFVGSTRGILKVDLNKFISQSGNAGSLK